VVSLEGWLDPLHDAESMRATDAWAIAEQGIPSLALMERAGAGLAAVVAERTTEGRILIACGKGNNGGDGLVAARLLREQGWEVDVRCTAAPEALEGDPRANLERLPGDPPAAWEASAAPAAATIVDALLGTGFDGEPREPVAGAIEAINASGATVVAADVPSGVNAASGAVAGAAVRAQATVTFHAPKIGLWVNPGKRHAGEVCVVDIGIGPGAPAEPAAGLISERITAEIPVRAAGATKFSEGAVVVAGGSAGLTGAPSLAAEAAARAGAGYVTACIPGSVRLIFELRLLEAMTRALPDDDGSLTPAALEPLLEAAQRADAVVLGPGLGRGEGAAELARAAALELDAPLLLDADGLNAHAGRLADLAGRSAPTVLTPHAGELGRLLEIESTAVEADRLRHARAAAEASQAAVILKGDDTLVVAPGGRLAVSPGASAGLATAGTGDVLAGATGAMLAKGLDPFTAAAAAVWLHAAAGRRAARERGPGGVIARDVIDALPHGLPR